MKLKQLYIDGIRGATQPLTIDFESNKRITMVYGENGNGKSSISDALVCLCTSRLGTLDDRSSTNKHHICAIGKKPEEVSITLTTDTGNFTANCNTTGTSFNKTPSSGFPSLRHIRRKPITELIDAKPTERYEVLKSYIDVSLVYKSEEELRKLLRTEKANLESITSVVQNSTELLSRIWLDEGMNGTDWRKWAETESETDIKALQKKKVLVDTAFADWQQVWTDLARRKEAHEAHKTTVEAKKQADKVLADFIAQNPEQDKVLYDVLNAASKYFKAEAEILNCPVCKQPVVAEALVEDIDTALHLMKQLQQLNTNTKSASDSEDKQRKASENAMATFLQSIERYCTSVATITTEDAEIGNIYGQAFLDTERTEQIQFLKVNFAEFRQHADQLGETSKQLSALIGRHNSISRAYQNLINNEAKHSTQTALVQRAEDALVIAEQLRKDFITAELVAITKTVNQLYSRIHPDEAQYGGISVSLDTSTKHSILIKGNFLDQTGISPQSLYSESHLDTLGICVLLALAKRYATADTILVLDDVVMSVDEKHLDRFIEMLHTDLTEFAHIFVTTHYRPWRERYRHHRAPGGHVQFLDLKPWCLEHGIRLTNGKVDLTELRELLEADDFNRRNVADLSGIILENIFDFLSVLYRCRVPRNARGEYVLRELVDCIETKLKNKLKVQHLKMGDNGKYSDALPTRDVELAPIIERIKALGIIRNWVGAHFNANADGVSDKEVRELGEATLELGELLTCPEHGNFPDRNKSGSYHETRSGSIRLHPLVMPN